MNTLFDYLQSIHPFSDELLQYLTAHIKSKSMRRKEYLLKSGQVSKHLCFITNGILRCYYLKGEKEVCTWFMKEGDVITSIKSFFSQTPGKEFIQAVDDCELYYISHDDYAHICKTYLEFNYIARELLTKYYILWDDLLVGIRMQTAAQRLEWLKKAHGDLFLRLPNKDLASFIGLTPVTLSKKRALR